jgi:hypothetical protein
VVSAADGQWLMQEPLQCILKPGGHGVIWKLASDEKVFDWFQDKGRKAAIVRQIRWGAVLLFLAPPLNGLCKAVGDVRGAQV